MNDCRELLERLIGHGTGGRRFTQDSPIMPDVWLAYGLHPGRPQDLLLTPRGESSPAMLASALRDRHRGERETAGDADRRQLWPSAPQVAYNQTSVVAKLHFHEMIRVALPLSIWWRDYLLHGDGAHPAEQFIDEAQRPALAADLTAALANPRYRESEGTFALTMVWLARVVGTIAHLNNLHASDDFRANDDPIDRAKVSLDALEQVTHDPKEIVRSTLELLNGMIAPDADEEPSLWSINRNRPSEAAIQSSVLTVKAEASRRLFKVGGQGICWAVLDSGIDATHLAFRRRDPESPNRGFYPEAFPSKNGDDREPWLNQTRIKATYDFTQIRQWLSADASLDDLPPELLAKASRLRVKSDLKKALKFGRDIDWELFGPLLRIEHDDSYTPPLHQHGTHVAGILAADWEAERGERYVGVCPEIELYDLRVLDENGVGDEFSIMAALQFVRHLNTRRNLVRDLMEIHGANLSFSLRHDVSHYGCGRTPVCEESERLVASGTVVVAAAGNRGRARYMTTLGQIDEGYRPISITDPGNAESVITVGATHRSDPHSFGVSYFSSRGPTGDGRRKPDILAPGEKITSTIPGNDKAIFDGTSMAAPHVSGAAALLMQRHSELRGRPRIVKEVLTSSATDLGRMRDFQGAGLVDILRALQSI